MGVQTHVSSGGLHPAEKRSQFNAVSFTLKDLMERYSADSVQHRGKLDLRPKRLVA